MCGVRRLWIAAMNKVDMLHASAAGNTVLATFDCKSKNHACQLDLCALRANAGSYIKPGRYIKLGVSRCNQIKLKYL